MLGRVPKSGIAIVLEDLVMANCLDGPGPPSVVTAVSVFPSPRVLAADFFARIAAPDVDLSVPNSSIAPATAIVFRSIVEAEGTFSVMKYFRRKLLSVPGGRLVLPLPDVNVDGVCSAAVRSEK